MGQGIFYDSFYDEIGDSDNIFKTFSKKDKDGTMSDFTKFCLELKAKQIRNNNYKYNLDSYKLYDS